MFSSAAAVLEQELSKKLVGAVSAGRTACVTKDACLASEGLKSPETSVQTLEQLEVVTTTALSRLRLMARK